MNETTAAGGASPWRNPILLATLAVTGAVAVMGIVNAQALASFASSLVKVMFHSRGWFIMLTVSAQTLVCVWLALSRYGQIRLGDDHDRPEFSTVSWLTMLFAAGMGVGLLYWGAAEPVTHFLTAKDYVSGNEAANVALFITNFHWGLHAWGIYALTALVIAYFGFRKGQPQLISAPIRHVFGVRPWTRLVGSLSDLLAIVAIAIGLGGSVAMGVFQVTDGVGMLLGIEAGQGVALAVFVVLCLSFILPLTVDLGRGMALLSNTAMLIAGALLVFVLLAGPTHFIMSGVVETFGDYLSGVFAQGFKTYTFFDERVGKWFGDWTLTYMVWWLAWAPFVGVFIARISRGRTIREFVVGVMLVPTAFSIVWFGVFGGIGFHEVLHGGAGILEVVRTNASATTFYLLGNLPLSVLTMAATIVAAFLFVVTSVVSAAYVLSMFSTGGSLDPPVRIKLVWGVILGALGLVMIL
jgi:glycine betaine transporter